MIEKGSTSWLSLSWQRDCDASSAEHGHITLYDFICQKDRNRHTVSTKDNDFPISLKNQLLALTNRWVMLETAFEGTVFHPEHLAIFSLAFQKVDKKLGLRRDLTNKQEVALLILNIGRRWAQSGDDLSCMLDVDHIVEIVLSRMAYVLQ